MRNKYWRYFAFFMYSWLIYNSFLFIGAPILIYSYGISEYIAGIAMLLTVCFYFIFLLDYRAITNIILLILLGGLVYCIPVHLWLRKQSILTAFLLSVLNLLMGTGSLFFWNCLFPNQPKSGPFLLLAVCLFYILLYYGNKLQKKYYPGNKVANRIRSWLKAPCLRT